MTSQKKESKLVNAFSNIKFYSALAIETIKNKLEEALLIDTDTNSTYKYRFNNNSKISEFRYKANKLKEIQKIIDVKNIKNLKTKIEENEDIFFNPLNGGELKISFDDFKNNYSFNINGDKSGWAASIIKVPIMVSAMRHLDQGHFSLNSKLTIDHKYPLEKTDTVTRLKTGTKISVEELIYLMITESDNEATNMLSDYIGIKKINQDFLDLGYKKTALGHLLAHGVHRYKTKNNPSGSNITTTNDMNKILRHIYEKKSATKESCEFMIDVLEHEKFKIGRKYIPKSNIIGSKIGLISDPFSGDDIHNVSVVNRDYALSIMLNKVNSKFSTYKDLKKREKISEAQLLYEDETKDESLDAWFDLLKHIKKFEKENNYDLSFDLIGIPRKKAEISSPQELISLVSGLTYELYYKNRLQ
ncbi:class A beta-lactamase-related serine hydrolase [Candidatus Woesearchaeota archaeon]|nr:class A beta-lactamase-related serine hydrolase [Candidatus Woesearchaeota archaeon]